MRPPALSTITRLLTAHLTGRPGWDEAPALLALAPHRAAGWDLVPLQAPGLARAHPADALEDLVGSVAAGRALPAPPGLWGLALRYEAFAAPFAPGITRVDATTPGSVEVRMMTASDARGRRYLLQQRRDTGEVEELFTITGRIPTALDRLLAALPQRPS